MSIITKMLKGVCVYWPLKSNESGEVAYDNYGQPQHTSPIEIKCRWEDVAVEFIDTKGTTQISKAMVYVESDVELGGMLFRGELTDVTDQDNPRENNGAWEIKRFDKLPNFKETEYLRTAYL